MCLDWFFSKNSISKIKCSDKKMENNIDYSVGRIGGGSYSPSEKESDSFDKVGIVTHQSSLFKVCIQNFPYEFLSQL